MKAKPKGPKYRNLSARAGSIYYERVWRERRHCFSARTTDWDQAAAVRDLYEQRKGIGLNRVQLFEVPTFADLAKRYLANDIHHLADTTRRLRENELSKREPTAIRWCERRAKSRLTSLRDLSPNEVPILCPISR